MADTLVRSTLGLDPAELSNDEWARQAAMAEWMEESRAARIAKIIAKMMG